MGRAPSRFCFEGSLCSIARVEVGPLLCESLIKHWCLLLPTPYTASLFDIGIDTRVKLSEDVTSTQRGRS
jgi:hypothetical protein